MGTLLVAAALVLACVFIHEGGHYIAARRRGVPVLSWIIGIWLVGIERNATGVHAVLFPHAKPSVQVDTRHASIKAQIAFYRAGARANLAAGILALAGGAVTGTWWLLELAGGSLAFWIGNTMFRTPRSDAQKVALLRAELPSGKEPRRR